MPRPIEELGTLITRKRQGRGVRAAAAEAGVSHSTLSRVENGHMPDLLTFARICQWLEVDAGEFLGTPTNTPHGAPKAVVHFRKDKTVRRDPAGALGELILAAQRAKEARLSLIHS
jgi:transcriptional regulator with XRE-family HTH domain